MRGIRLAQVAIAATLTATSSAAADISVQVEAGLGGLGRSGRWMPVRVDVATPGPPIEGDLVVEWGGARVRHAFTLGAGSRKQFQLFIRATDVRDVITARVDTDGGPVESTSPVRVATSDEVVTVCGADAARLSATACSVVVAPDDLPRSSRGYAAADRLVLTAADRAALAADQREALQLWESMRRLEDLGLSSVAMPPDPSAGDLLESMHRQLTLYGFVMVGVLLAARRVGRGLTLLPVMAIATLVMSAGVLALGRVGPGARVHVHQAATLQQFEGAGGVLVAGRGVVEHPAFEDALLRAEMSDGTLQAGQSPSLTSDERRDADGMPVLVGTFGLGSTTRFTLEGVDARPVLAVSRSGRMVRLTNASALSLDECELSGFSRRQVGTLAPGQTVDADQTGGTDDPRLTCTMRGSPYGFSDARGGVAADGTTVVVYHVSSGAND